MGVKPLYLPIRMNVFAFAVSRLFPCLYYYTPEHMLFLFQNVSNSCVCFQASHKSNYTMKSTEIKLKYPVLYSLNGY